MATSALRSAPAGCSLQRPVPDCPPRHHCLQARGCAFSGGGRRPLHLVREDRERVLCRTASPELSLSSTLAFAGPLQVDKDLITLSEVEDVVARRGLKLTLRTLGPFYRFVIRDSKASQDEASSTEAEKSGTVMAVSSGYTVPAMGLMHCDSLQIFTRGLRGSEGERLRGGILGLGLLMGGAVFSYGYSRGCRKAEILAIKDDDLWHKRLVSYYSRFGFKPVREVGDSGLRDLPDLLVWGGVGMRMDADIALMLKQWSQAIRHSGRTAKERARAESFQSM